MIDGDDLLVIRRCKDGRDYTVLPGGGVEVGESPEAACVRELFEETGLHGIIRQAIPVSGQLSCQDHYFHVTVGHREVRLGEPERSRLAVDNWYEPQWVAIKRAHTIGLVPDAAVAAVDEAHRLCR